MAGEQAGADGVDISLVVPVYNEETNIGPFLRRTAPVLESLSPSYEIIFVLDPCSDRTEEVITAEMARDARVRLMVMTRRWGQPACTMAGIEASRGRATAVIDVDLQDPPELLRDMWAKWKEGFAVVYAQRRSRKGETLPKRIVSWVGYYIINHISDVRIPRNTGDFRLMDRKVVEGLRGLRETHGFLRGLVAYVGYPQTAILYDRDERAGGDSKYNQITGSLRIGFNGIVAFSSRPLTLATILGFATATLSMLMTLLYVGTKLIGGTHVETGVSPVLLMVTFIGGVQLICLGIMGEYIGRIYEEVRGRPKYLVARRVNFPEKT